MSGSRNHPEDIIQIAILDAARLLLPDYKVIAIPNGGKRSKIEAAIMQGLGVEAGAADLLIFRGGFCGFIEVKTDARDFSTAQIRFQEECARTETPYAVARSADEAAAAWASWGIIERSEGGALRAVRTGRVGEVARPRCVTRRRESAVSLDLRGVQDKDSEFVLGRYIRREN